MDYELITNNSIMTYTTLGIVLKRREAGDDDYRYSIYTKEHGKVEAVAQGVRKIRSKLAAHLEPLSMGEFMFANGRRIERLIQAKVQNNFPRVKNNLVLLGQASYVADLTELLTKPGLKDHRIFNLLVKSLHDLEKSQSAAHLEQIFSSKLLQLLGFELLLRQCVVCHHSFDTPLSITIDPVKGGAVCLNCSQEISPGATLISSLTLDVIKNIYSMEIEKTGPLELPALVSQELKLFVDNYLQTHLEFKPKSKNFLDFIESHPQIYVH